MDETNRPDYEADTPQRTHPAADACEGPVQQTEPDDDTKVRQFLKARQHKRHQIEMAVLLYVALCFIAVILLDILFGIRPSAPVLVSVAAGSFAVFAPVLWRVKNLFTPIARMRHRKTTPKAAQNPNSTANTTQNFGCPE